MSEREEFERHYASMNDGFCPTMYDGEYDWGDAQRCWETWQAARAGGEVAMACSYCGGAEKAAGGEPVALPDEIEKVGLNDPANLAYCDGWNDCRKEMLSNGMVRVTHPPAKVPEGFKVRQNAEGDYVVTRLSDMGAVAFCKDSPSAVGVMGWHFIEALLNSSPAKVPEWLGLIESECWDLRCVSDPTPGGDDADVVWQVIEHHMAKPRERVIGVGSTPLAALQMATNPPTQEGE